MATQLEQLKHLRGFPCRVTVDGFAFLRSDPQRSERHLCILTHFHSDHTNGLTKSFQGELLCTQITADLVVNVIGVEQKYVRALELRRTYDFDGLEITALDAFHCPGAAIFLLKNKRTGYTVLHTGDFRAAMHLQQDELLLAQQIDTIYLDTTYCSPRYAFAEQSEVLAMVEQITKRELEEEPNTCFVVGTYQIGKEKVVQTVARAAGSKCYVAAAKERLLRLCQLWDDDLFTTTNEEGVRVFVRSLMDTFPNGTPANQAGSGETEDSKFARVCIFRPTGWTLKKDSTTQYKPWIEGRKRQYAVPYSEHSSFDELVAFVRAMKPRRIIPTVNAANDNRTESMLKHFLPYMDLSSDKKRLDSYFSTQAQTQPLKYARVEKVETEIVSSFDVSETREVYERADTTPSIVERSQQTTEITTEEVVDLEAVDVEEQRRIWEQIRIRTESATSTMATLTTKIEAAPFSSPSASSAESTTCPANTPKRQSSLKAFFGEGKGR